MLRSSHGIARPQGGRRKPKLLLEPPGPFSLKFAADRCAFVVAPSIGVASGTDFEHGNQ